MTMTENIAEPIEAVAAISELQKMTAMANDVDGSEDVVEFAGKQFPIVHLKYKDYMAYLAIVQPVIGSIVGLLSPNREEDIEFATIVNSLGDVLPALVKLSLRQTDKTVTSQFVEDNADSPFQLIVIIEKQIKKNNMVEDFRSFFARYQAMIPKNLLS